MSAPAWHPDPYDRHQFRWFDGDSWTSHVSDAGVTSVDPYGTGITPVATLTYATPAPGSGRPILLAVVAAVVLAAAAGGVFLFLGGEDDTSLATEIDGIRALLNDANPDVDDFEPLGDSCVVDVIDLLSDADVVVAGGAEPEEAAAFSATGFDKPFYDCYVAVGGGRGYALDAVETGDGVSLDDLEALLEDVAEDVDRVDDDLHDGVVLEACDDAEVLEDGDTVDDRFCEYYWTFDGAGLAIVAAAHESLDMDGPEVLDVAVPEFLEALREAAE